MRLEDKFIQVIKENEGVIFKITTVYTRNADEYRRKHLSTNLA